MKENSTQLNKKSIVKVGISLLVVLLVLAAAAFTYNRYTKSESYTQKKAAQQTEKVLDKVSKLLILPEGEPSIFSVEDPAVLVTQQAFFVGAVKGDQLLVYPEAGKAILYSPSRDIIVNVGPVTGNTDSKIIEKNIEKPQATSIQEVTKAEAIKKATTTKNI